MKNFKNILYFVLGTLVLVSVPSCEPNAIQPEDVFVTTDSTELAEILKNENAKWDGQYRIYNMNDFLDAFMHEKGNLLSDTTPYRARSTVDNKFYLYSVDTIPTDTIGIYIRGRVCTDDFGGNFYKALVLQQVTDWNTGEAIDQQCLRVSVDMGSVNGLYQMGQEILIRCNGFSVGRYANQPQLCVPAYNNNIYGLTPKTAMEKIGWGPGRIPAAQFRKATKMIGFPDRSKLQYDTCLIKDLFNKVPRKIDYNNSTEDEIREFMRKVRFADGRLVVIRRVFFTGYTTNSNYEVTKCIYHDPNPPYKDDSASFANVFAPTTNNINYPPSRILCDARQKFDPTDNDQLVLCCSNSEYNKYANFFLPGAMPDFKDAIENCQYCSGTVTGILGWYCDNAIGTKTSTLTHLVGREWSVTPRGIPGIGIPDINMKFEKGTSPYEDGSLEWKPEEFDMKEYEAKKKALNNE